MIKTIIALLFSIIGQQSFAGSPPAWVLVNPKSDGEYKYYVGRASLLATDSAAMDEARKNVFELALKDNFSTSFSIQSTQTETLSETSSSHRINESSNRVRFNDFNFVENYIQPHDDGKYSAWVLYKYSISAVKAEQERLKNSTSSEDQFSESSDSVCNSNNNATLEVTASGSDGVTSIGDATVTLDDEPYGKTPLRINEPTPI